MHVHLRQLFKNIGHGGEFRPVELHVLPGAQVSVTAVVVSGDMGELAQLLRGQRAVGHGHPEHWRQALNVQAVTQSQLQKLALRQLAGEIAIGLLPVVGYPFGNKLPVEGVVAIHWSICGTDQAAGRPYHPP